MKGAGARNLLELGWCKALANKLKNTPEIATLLPVSAVSVQCTYFEKNETTNWLVALHQDLAIPVKEKCEHPDFGTWSNKEGQLFVQAPDMLLQQLLVVRVHLDDCGLENGPLRVVPGSHRYGRLNGATIDEIRKTSEEVTCLARMGDCVLMRPLILHASSKASSPGHRRVLHFLYGPASPGYGLKWQYAV